MSNSIIDQQRDNADFFWIIDDYFLPTKTKPLTQAQLDIIKRMGEAVIDTIKLLYGLK